MSRKFIQLVMIAALIAAPAFATTVMKMDLSELVSKSDAIVQGTVESVDMRWENQSIYTYTSIRVDEGMKGGPRRAILLKHPGGKIGSLHLDIPGMPVFKQGDQVIVFARDRKDGTFDLVGLGQGKYDVVNNFAITNSAGVRMLDPQTGQFSEAGPVDRKPVDSFKAQIRGLVK